MVSLVAMVGDMPILEAHLVFEERFGDITLTNERTYGSRWGLTCALCI